MGVGLELPSGDGLTVGRGSGSGGEADEGLVADDVEEIDRGFAAADSDKAALPWFDKALAQKSQLPAKLVEQITRERTRAQERVAAAAPSPTPSPSPKVSPSPTPKVSPGPAMKPIVPPTPK